MRHVHKPWLARQFQRCLDQGLWRVCLEDGVDIMSVVIVMAPVNQSNDLIAGLIAVFGPERSVLCSVESIRCKWRIYQTS